jgi:hypothetical protein
MKGVVTASGKDAAFDKVASKTAAKVTKQFNDTVEKCAAELFRIVGPGHPIEALIARDIENPSYVYCKDAQVGYRIDLRFSEDTPSISITAEPFVGRLEDNANAKN